MAKMAETATRARVKREFGPQISQSAGRRLRGVHGSIGGMVVFPTTTEKAEQMWMAAAVAAVRRPERCRSAPPHTGSTKDKKWPKPLDN